MSGQKSKSQKEGFIIVLSVCVRMYVHITFESDVCDYLGRT